MPCLPVRADTPGSPPEPRSLSYPASQPVPRREIIHDRQSVLSSKLHKQSPYFSPTFSLEDANGIFNVTNGSAGTEYGDCFMKLSTTNGLAVVDYFTPWNQADLQDQDKDLGSGGPLILPDQPGAYPHELLGAGKQGQIYVLNRDQFTTGNKHFDANNIFDFVVQTNLGQIKGSGSFDTQAYFNNRIYYAGSGDNLKFFSFSNSLLSATAVSTSSRTFNSKGATPSVSANGTNNGIVWALQMPTSLGNPATLVAYNATNLTTELYNSANNATRDQLGGGVKFAVPTVTDGKVFVGSANSVSVFGLLGGTFSFSSPNYSVQEADTNVAITVNRMDGTNGAAQVSYATVAGGTASDGTNYTGVSGTLNWTNGESSAKTFTIPIFNDNLAEVNPTIYLGLNNPTNIASALGLQSTAVLTIVEPPVDAWKLFYFGANANDPATAGDSADPEQDGIVNLLEYAYAFNPLISNTNPFTASLTGNQFQLHFPRNISASDITFIVQSSTDLITWSNLMTYTAASGWVTNMVGTTVAESATNGVPPNQYVNVTVTSSTNVTANAADQFLRLEIHR